PRDQPHLVEVVPGRKHDASVVRQQPRAVAIGIRRVTLPFASQAALIERRAKRQLLRRPPARAATGGEGDPWGARGRDPGGGPPRGNGRERPPPPPRDEGTGGGQPARAPRRARAA